MTSFDNVAQETGSMRDCFEYYRFEDISDRYLENCSHKRQILYEIVPVITSFEKNSQQKVIP